MYFESLLVSEGSSEVTTAKSTAKKGQRFKEGK